MKVKFIINEDDIYYLSIVSKYILDDDKFHNYLLELHKDFHPVMRDNIYHSIAELLRKFKNFHD